MIIIITSPIIMILWNCILYKVYNVNARTAWQKYVREYIQFNFILATWWSN